MKSSLCEIENLGIFAKKNNMKTSLLALLFICFISCGEDVSQPVDYASLNDQQIQDYLAENELEAEKTASGLYYIIDSVGTGLQPTSTDEVRVAYKGYFSNGNVFDQSAAEGVTFNLQQVIKGWTEGITYFNEGGSGKLFVPAHLAYGSRDYNGIPGGSLLIFDIDLLEVNGGGN
jgi:FKBP-type peptidyl-prolyl cis-trans isomerase FkpA